MITKPPESIPKGRGHRDPSRWVAVVVAGVSLATMVALSGSASMWGDEGFTAGTVRQTWADFAGDLTRIDYNMSLYYLGAKSWAEILGYSPQSLRLLSVVSVASALVFIYLLTSRLWNQRVAALAVGIAALNPFVFTIGLTARPYALLLAWSVGSWLLIVAILNRDSALSWFGYGLIAAVGLHIHLIAALVIASQAAFVLIARRPAALSILAAAAPIAGALIPTIVFNDASSAQSWGDQFTLPALNGAVVGALGGRLVGAIILLLAIAGISRPLRDRRQSLLLLWILIPTVAMLVLSPVQSFAKARYATPVIPAIAILAALGLGRVLERLRPVGVVAGGLLVVGFLSSLSPAPALRNEDFRGLARAMEGQVQEGDVIAFPNPYYRIVAEQYSLNEDAGPYPPGDAALPSEDWGTLTPRELDEIRSSGVQSREAVIRRELGDEARVWLVGLPPWLEEAEGVLSEMGYERTQVVAAEGVEARLLQSR